MSRTQSVVRGALLMGAAAGFMACQSDHFNLSPNPVNPLFVNYVALGNSITAGYQSGGINDSTQAQSYAVLIARAMGTRFAYPALLKPGCPPPVNNLLTQARVGGATSTATSCFYRSTTTTTLNNVAVPGVASADPVATIAVGSNAANPLINIILGGKTMVAKALDANPTFATIWIGNNDILGPATSGLIGPATPAAQFATNYAAMMNALMAGAPQLKGVLIGVVQVAQVPLLFQAGVLAASPAAAGAAAQVAGRPVTLDPTTCAGANAGALVSFPYLAAIKNRAANQPGTVFCQPVAGGGANDPGDNGILDITEQATVSARINAYNAYIKAKADSLGFAYYDPNPTLATLKADPTKIPPFPNLASATAPFGQYFSLDGVHPSAATHLLLANEMITAINAKFSTSIPAAVAAP
ncbi:MAG TPA: SGNH/GDSL hydrolase family protein [Gemmatimonadaceae bacterium]|jgi:lysophospholipase L1-like esterase